VTFPLNVLLPLRITINPKFIRQHTMIPLIWIPSPNGRLLQTLIANSNGMTGYSIYTDSRLQNHIRTTKTYNSRF
jgi:hypothetical protein